MDSGKNQEELTRVGPGTLMGEMMRQYWIPALVSSELEVDGPPTRLMLLGEQLIAFRDTSGRVGIMDHRCPHRCASLFLGRNEEDGIRCIYHGWKFDVEGNCTEMPNLPSAQRYMHRVRARAYPVLERNGLIWTYMGARGVPPPHPMIEATLLPESSVTFNFVQRECNWLQALEGDIDTSHFGFLHVGHVDPDELAEDNPVRNTVAERAPEYHVTDTEWGTSYGAYRPALEEQTYWRFANFLLPFWTQQPQGRFSQHVHARAWVPLDDTHTMFISVMWKDVQRGMINKRADGTTIPGLEPIKDYLPNDTGWFGRWRLAANASNDWRIDREAQRSGQIYSGIDMIHLQDQAVTESMGPITDFSFEHLGPSDRMITRTRRRLLRTAKAWRDKTEVPPGVDNPELMLSARSGFFLAPAASDWQDAYSDQVERAVRPARQTRETEGEPSYTNERRGGE